MVCWVLVKKAGPHESPPLPSKSRVRASAGDSKKRAKINQKFDRILYEISINFGFILGSFWAPFFRTDTFIFLSHFFFHFWTNMGTKIHVARGAFFGTFSILLSNVVLGRLGDRFWKAFERILNNFRNSLGAFWKHFMINS